MKKSLGMVTPVSFSLFPTHTHVHTRTHMHAHTHTRTSFFVAFIREAALTKLTHHLRGGTRSRLSRRAQV